MTSKELIDAVEVNSIKESENAMRAISTEEWEIPEFAVRRSTKRSNQMSDNERMLDELVGRWFIQLKDGVVSRAGQIRSITPAPDSLILIQVTMDKGTTVVPSGALVPLNDLSGVVLFSDEADWRTAFVRLNGGQR